MKYFALLTKLGENLIAQATALGTKIELTHMAVGDGGGSLPTPDTNQTKLIAEKRRAAINTLFIDEKNKNQIIAEQIIPESEGGWWIREIGLFDKTGNLIAVANCPETYKPQLTEGSGRTQSIRMVLIVSHTDSVTLKIDPSVVLATREYVNTEITVLDKKIDALSAQVKLDLSKKFDKSNISDVKGNARDKVPSLDLFTIETGKLATKVELASGLADKQPVGDYVTTQALNDGLSKKFDKTGGNVDGLVSAKNEVAVTTNNSMMSMKTLDSVRGPHFVSKIENGSYRTHELQDSSGVLMHLGDYGWGGVGAREDLTEQQVENKFKTGVTQVWRNQSNSTKYAPQFAASIFAKAYDTFLNISMGHSNGNITATSGVSGNSADTFKIANLYSDLNTSTDRNGCLRTSTNHELSDYPVGSPIAWSQSSPPAGYLVCNGQSFNKTTYPLLAKAYPSGTLPDLRGEFIRGLDAGRNIDTGRAALSSQGDAIRNIVGTIHVHNTLSNDSVTGAFSKIGDTTQGWGLTTLSTSAGNIEFNARNVVPVANENRPRNIAFLYIVRAA